MSSFLSLAKLNRMLFRAYLRRCRQSSLHFDRFPPIPEVKSGGLTHSSQTSGFYHTRGFNVPMHRIDTLQFRSSRAETNPVQHLPRDNESVEKSEIVSPVSVNAIKKEINICTVYHGDPPVVNILLYCTYPCTTELNIN